MENSWENDVNQKIGYKLEQSDIVDIVAHVNKGIENFRPEDFKELRTQLFYNWGHSQEVLADYVMGQSVPLAQE